MLYYGGLIVGSVFGMILVGFIISWAIDKVTKFDWTKCHMLALSIIAVGGSFSNAEAWGGQIVALIAYSIAAVPAFFALQFLRSDLIKSQR